MFKESVDDRLSSWAQHRVSIETSSNPLEDVWNFWKDAPYIPYNNKVDPYHSRNWPTPWEMIIENKYDDFTKAVMIGKTLKFTQRFKDSAIQIRTYVDNARNIMYNVVMIDELWIINYNDNGPVSVKDLPAQFSLENLVELETAR
jgi:hypothetical protein